LIKINKLFIPYIILLIILGFKGSIFISLFFVILHECVHYLIAKKYGFNGLYIEIMPFGTMLNLKDLNDAEPMEDLVISLAGPIFNIFCGLVFFVINHYYNSELVSHMCLTNISLGIFNLIPAFPLDGGRICRDILARRTIYKVANSIVVEVSQIIGIVFVVVFLLALMFGVNNLSIGIIGIFILYASYKEKERIVYIIMADIIKKKVRFLDKGYIENKSISINYKEDLLKAMSILDKNKYNIFIVLDDNMKCFGMMYEEEVISALKSYGNITIDQYILMLKKEDNEDMSKLSEKAIEEWEQWSEN
jgi:stage IV sporulation protein FB